jgi:predicted cupin superfamily sugar epimerase
MDPDTIIATLGMRPHPEGGWYVETWRADAPAGERPAGTAIYFLQRAGESSAWHRVDAAETWHWYAGAALELRIAAGHGGEAARSLRLGPDLPSGERPQLVVPAGDWQAARSLGAWTLVGCTVSPGFRFDGFELAEPGWEPGPSHADRWAGAHDPDGEGED